MEICSECPHNSKHHQTIRPDEHCVKCGCTLSAKTRCLSCVCPIKKWVEIMTGEQEEQFKKMTEDGREETSDS